MADRSMNQARLLAWGGAAALTVLPVLALRGIDPAAWDPPGDFVFLALFAAGTGLAFELAARVPARRAYSAAVAAASAAGLLHLWMNLAVGIIGSEDNPANSIFYVVPAVAMLGAAFARFAAAGMARATAAAAGAQLLTFAVAAGAGLGFTGPITVFFTALWLASAWLFAKAARARTAAA